MHDKAALPSAAVFGIAVGLLFLTAVLPVIFDTFFSADTTNWSIGALNIWDALPVIILASIILIFGRFGRGSSE